MRAPGLNAVDGRFESTNIELPADNVSGLTQMQARCAEGAGSQGAACPVTLRALVANCLRQTSSIVPVVHLKAAAQGGLRPWGTMERRMADRNPPLTQYRGVGWTPILAFVLRENIYFVVRKCPYEKESDKNPPAKVGGFFLLLGMK